MSALAGTIKKQNSRFPLSIYTNHRRFYSLSNLLKVHSSKILKKITFQKTFSSNSLISLRDLNIQRALQRKAMSDFLLQKNTDTIIQKIPYQNYRNNYYLPLVYERKSQISGLMSISNKEFSLLQDTTVLGKAFRKYIASHYLQIYYNFYAKEKHENINNMLKNISHVLKTFDSKVSFNIKQLFAEKAIPLKQHLLSTFFLDKNFNYNNLYHFCKDLNVEIHSYNQQLPIKINTFIEAFIASD
jgi:hypothetical protein